MASRIDSLVAIMRCYLRDYPELNRLTDGFEHIDSSIKMAIYDAVEDFNMSSPLPAYTADNFPAISLLKFGVMKYLLESVTLLQARNNLQYSDGQGVQVNDSNKAPMYMSLISKYTQEWEQKKISLIAKMNMRNAMGGGVTSDFYQIMDRYNLN